MSTKFKSTLATLSTLNTLKSLGCSWMLLEQPGTNMVFPDVRNGQDLSPIGLLSDSREHQLRYGSENLYSSTVFSSASSIEYAPRETHLGSMIPIVSTQATRYLTRPGESCADVRHGSSVTFFLDDMSRTQFAVTPTVWRRIPDLLGAMLRPSEASAAPTAGIPPLPKEEVRTNEPCKTRSSSPEIQYLGSSSSRTEEIIAEVQRKGEVMQKDVEKNAAGMHARESPKNAPDGYCLDASSELSYDDYIAFDPPVTAGARGRSPTPAPLHASPITLPHQAVFLSHSRPVTPVIRPASPTLLDSPSPIPSLTYPEEPSPVLLYDASEDTARQVAARLPPQDSSAQALLVDVRNNEKYEVRKYVPRYTSYNIFGTDSNTSDGDYGGPPTSPVSIAMKWSDDEDIYESGEGDEYWADEDVDDDASMPSLWDFNMRPAAQPRNAHSEDQWSTTSSSSEEDLRSSPFLHPFYGAHYRPNMTTLYSTVRERKQWFRSHFDQYTCQVWRLSCIKVYDAVLTRAIEEGMRDVLRREKGCDGGIVDTAGARVTRKGYWDRERGNPFLYPIERSNLVEAYVFFERHQTFNAQLEYVSDTIWFLDIINLVLNLRMGEYDDELHDRREKGEFGECGRFIPISRASRDGESYDSD